MKREGLTFTMVFLAESANYGEGIGNITTLKKMTRGNCEQYSYISRQAMRYNIIQQLKWDNTPVDGKSGVVQFAPSVSIKDYPETDLFGYNEGRFCEYQKCGGSPEQRDFPGTISERSGISDEYGNGKKRKPGERDRAE